MARPKKTYEQKAITTSIKFTSRASIQIEGKFYTMEACEERIIPDIAGINLEQERKLLWDTVNLEVDNQLIDCENTYKKNN